ncbi:hypothetical protein QJS04_geneDACA016525 [Acorus gramineus]|uniref:Domain X domain-containing protein n=1 Tax=Acorus gramineus TaxID=55184 RepID=A0AAV9BA05_ACOGR|nr:hypothetical protein QJS04_geneDACA016525 [Acorus gramineus]
MLGVVRKGGFSVRGLWRTLCVVRAGHSVERFRFCEFHSTLSSYEDDDVKRTSDTHNSSAPHVSLAKSLACLTETSSAARIEERPPQTRMQLKRSIELRIKKRVKAQFSDGKFRELMMKVISSPNTLRNAYNCVRINSNIDLRSHDNSGLCFASMSEELARGEFDIQANTTMFDQLVLPNMKLRVVQEAIRVALEVVYRPHFSKTSHGCRSGRGHRSALKYVRKKIRGPNRWLSIKMHKKADARVVSKLLSMMEERIEDVLLFNFVLKMFENDALNLEFGGFPKGEGLPQEGALSPILMNVYLGVLDRELFRLRLRYEGLLDRPSDLRHWFRMQIKDSDDQTEDAETSRTKLHVCRWMDEVLIAVSGSECDVLELKAEIQSFLIDSLFIDAEVSVVDDACRLQFLGVTIRLESKEREAVRAVHKLKDKVRYLGSQKQEIWERGTARIGEKWLARGLRRLKESEIKQLNLSTPTLDKISCHRKEGMKTEHWFKQLLKVWLRDTNAVSEESMEAVLSMRIAEPALPRDLVDSHYEFQRRVREYVSSETSATLALLNPSSGDGEPVALKVEAPVAYMQRSLFRYGLINREGIPRRVASLAFQDDAQIIHWFTGLARRWFKCHHECNNFCEIETMIVDVVRMSCLRTLGAKHRISESNAENRFEEEMAQIPSSKEDVELQLASETVNDDDEALMYGVSHGGLCVLRLMQEPASMNCCDCFVFGCSEASSGEYAVHVMEKQRFPGWRTGFSPAIHVGLNRRHIGLCRKHVDDLYLGFISLQCVNFGRCNS